MKKIILILLALGIFIFGCTSKDIVDVDKLTGNYTSDVQYISNPSSNLTLRSFNINKESSTSNYLVYFVIYDNEKKGYVRTDVNVELMIYDDGGVLYEESRKVKKTEFGIENQVDFEIDGSKVKKTIYDKVNAKITLKLQGKEYSAERQIYDIQKYSDQEINQMTDEQYMNNAKIVGQTITVGDFDVTVQTAGEYYNGKYLRFDLQVSAIGDSVLAFQPTEIKVIANGEELKYGGRGGPLKATTSYYQPGETKTGYVYFYLDPSKGMPSDVEMEINGNYMDSGRNEQVDTKTLNIYLR